MSRHIGVLAGAFNPVTRAHLALADAASRIVDEVVCVVPRSYPHKEFHGAALEQRIEMLQSAGGRYRIERTDGGLFVEIARELRQPDTEISFICGRDAAERIVRWDYGAANSIENIMEEFSLLVAGREGFFEPPDHLRHRVRLLELPEDFSHVSSTEVRRRLASGEPWEHLVPEPIVSHVRKIYAA